jgi:hypothetical protein
MKKTACAVTFLAILLLAGCVSRSSIVTSTGTMLGFELAQNPASQMYQLKFGYSRAEWAAVPVKITNSLVDVPDVILELRYKGVFSSDGALYQRLAIGSEAVKQPGASMMFAKDSAGQVSLASAAALTSIHGAMTSSAKLLLPLATAYHASPRKAEFDEAARRHGFKDFVTFILTQNLSSEVIAALSADLKQKGLLP